MIVGNGLLAKSFLKSSLGDDFLIFASGVSNSTSTTIDDFKREKDLLIKSLSINKEKKLIYFSSFFSTTVETPYLSHKREIENIIKSTNNTFYIFRLPQIIGIGGNPYNIINLFVMKILNKDTIEVWKDSKRSIIDVEDVVRIVSWIVENKVENKIYDISKIESIYVLEIVEILEDILNQKSNILLVDKNTSKPLNNSPEIDEAITNLSIDRDKYTKKILKKYVRYN